MTTTCRKGLHKYKVGRGCPECKRMGRLNYTNPAENRRRVQAWNVANPGKSKERTRAWRLANPEAYRDWVEVNREHVHLLGHIWWAANPEKSQGYRLERLKLIETNPGHEKIATRDLAALFRFQEGRCVYCTNMLSDGSREVHLDHVVPLSRGGPHALSNLAWACRGCNIRKKDRTAEEFRKAVA